MIRRMETMLHNGADAELRLRLHATQLHLEKGENEQAVQLVRELHARFPESDEVALYLGGLLRLAGNLAESSAMYEQVLSRTPRDLDAWDGLIINCLLEGDRKCCTDMAARLKGEPALPGSHPRMLVGMAGLLLWLGDPLKALALLEKAHAESPGHPTVLHGLGQLHLAMGNVRAAQETIDALRPHAPVMADELLRSREPQDGALGAQDTALSFSDEAFAISPMRIFTAFDTATGQSSVGLSIVVPIKDEEENLPILYGQVSDVLATLKQPYEIIFVDDGSTDRSRAILRALAFVDKRVRVVMFRRNYGQTAALSAGFKVSRGAVVITMDGDLQNDPRDIPALLQKMAEGYDLVNGWRSDRKDTLITRKIPSRMANRIINFLISGTGVQLHDFGCTLKAYKSEIVKNIRLYGEMHRFIPVFAAWLGVKVTEIPVNHRPRVHGHAKYNLSRVQRVIFDLVVVRFFSDYMTRPIQFFGKIAKIALQFGLGVLSLLGVLTWTNILPLQPDTFLILSSLLLLGCLQILVMGLTGELLIRSYFEIQNKDHYVVECILNE